MEAAVGTCLRRTIADRSRNAPQWPNADSPLFFSPFLDTAKMLALAKVAILVLVAILAFALSSEGRELLDYYGDCYGGENHQTSTLLSSTPRH